MKKFGFIIAAFILGIITLITLPRKNVFDHSPTEMLGKIQERTYIISVARYKEMAGTPDQSAILVDLRDPEVFSTGHIPGAVNLHSGLGDAKSMHRFMKSLGGNAVFYADQTSTASKMWILLTQMGYERLHVLETGPDLSLLIVNWDNLNDRGIMTDEVPLYTFTPDQNYEYLENNDVEAFVKYNYFHKEQSKKWKQDPYRIDNLHYNQQQDCFYCPMGQPMPYTKSRTRTTDNGYKQINRLYQAQNCEGCPMRGPCHRGKGNRTIEANPRLARYKEIIRERLNSERGKQYRSKRPVDVEAVFGIIKSNYNYRRFLLRSLEKVEIEAGLLSLAHNLRKMAN